MKNEAILQITSLAFVVLADLNGRGLLHCKVPPLLNGTGHLGNGTGRDRTGAGGAKAGVGREKGGSGAFMASSLQLQHTYMANSGTAGHMKCTLARC